MSSPERSQPESRRHMQVLIVDDEAPARLRLKRLLGEMEVVVSGEARSGREALLACTNSLPEIVLMDVRMPDMDGLEAARHLSRLPNPPAIIFTTAYDEMALEAFSAGALAYLLKPIRQDELDQALRRATRLNQAQVRYVQAGKRRTHLSSKVGNRLDIVAVSDVAYCQSEQKTTVARYLNGELVLTESLDTLEHEFEETFVRINRNLLVNRRHVRALVRMPRGGHGVRLKEGQLLPVSRRRVRFIRQQLKAGFSS